jgi:hypothetical protein
VYLVVIQSKGYTHGETNRKAGFHIFIEIIPLKGYIAGYGKGSAMGLEV